MDKKMKLRYRAALSLILSAILFCIPAVAFSTNKGNAIDAKAEESGAENETEQTAEEETESDTEDESETENDAALICTCGETCSPYEYDKDCGVCASDYKDCKYKSPNVSIKINKPKGWYNDSAKVKFSVSDIAHTGNFRVASIQAKVGQNGSWTDVTEEKKLEISENCTVYVQVTDQKGNTYERSRAIRCFDTTKPTLNAAVSDGLLSVQVHDTDSGAKAVYVNGYEFTKLTNGTLNIRLQQFDAGYEYFTISAMDNAGNMSEVYQAKNPYYKSPADGSDEDPAKQLPANAKASEPGSAEGTVKEYTKTDCDGTAIVPAPEEGGDADKEHGKEFYTIQTASDKVFYLIIDHGGEEEKVYFLTEVTENDLLNTTSSQSETLPKNSAALESAIPAEDSALPNNNGEMPERIQQSGEIVGVTENMEDTESIENMEETEAEEKAAGQNPAVSYILIGVCAAVFIAGAYSFKAARRKKECFIEDEDEDGEEYGEDESEEEEPDGRSGDYFLDEDTGE